MKKCAAYQCCSTGDSPGGGLFSADWALVDWPIFAREQILGCDFLFDLVWAAGVLQGHRPSLLVRRPGLDLAPC